MAKKRIPKGCIEVTPENAASIMLALDIRRVRACERSAQMMRKIGDPGGAEFFERLAYLPNGILPHYDDDDDGGLNKIQPPKPVRPGSAV